MSAFSVTWAGFTRLYQWQFLGLECCLSFAENCKAAPKTAGEVIEGLVQKCVAAPKTQTKDLATQICLMYCEAEAHEKVVEQLLGGFANKNPKVSFSISLFHLSETLSRLFPDVSWMWRNASEISEQKWSKFPLCWKLFCLLWTTGIKMWGKEGKVL